jgi:hypothetical protein
MRCASSESVIAVDRSRLNIHLVAVSQVLLGREQSWLERSVNGLPDR